MKTNNDYIYIYNYHQANFYIKNNVKCYEIGRNKSYFYFVFLKEDTRKMHDKWKEYEKLLPL